MAYYDAISNAIAARGNALAQAAQQQGQVYGNLASNLGQLPFQAMQAGQRRRALEVETQQRDVQTQDMQRKLDLQKKAYAIINDPSKSPEQKDFEMEELSKSDLEMYQRLQEYKSREKERNKQYELEKAAKDFTMRSGLPGTEFARPITPPPVNAFSPQMQPQVPVPQRQMEFETMVHPMNALGVRPPTDVDIMERQAATDALAMNKYAAQQKILEADREALERLRQQGRTDKPITAADTDVRMEGGVPVTYQFNPATQRFDIRVGEARPQSSISAGLGMPQFVGTQQGQAVVFQPSRGGTGKVTTVPLPGEGPILSKTETFEEGRAVNNAKSGLRAAATVRDILKDKNVLLQASIPGSPGQRKFNAARKEMVDVLTRLRTGAALNTDEEVFYTGQAPTLLDLTDPEAIEYKLKMFEDLYSGIANRRTGGATASAAPTGGGAAPAGRIVQRNKKTGAVRHSDDQGKTWQPGP